MIETTKARPKQTELDSEPVGRLATRRRPPGIAFLAAGVGMMPWLVPCRALEHRVGRPRCRRRLLLARHRHAGHPPGHAQFTDRHYLSRRTLAEDVRRGQAALATAGVRPALYRPPWLLRIPALPVVLREQGLRPVSGEFCHPLEVCQPQPWLIAEHALAKARPGSVIIFHDGLDGRGGNRASTVAAVKIVVDRLSRAGLGFVTVSDLLGLPACQDRPHRHA